MTGKQRRFAELVAGGESQSAAYREAYDAEGMSPSSVASEASRLMGHPEVARFVADARAEAARQAAWSLSVAVERLGQVNERCLMELLDGDRVYPSALRGFLSTLDRLNHLCCVDDEREENSFDSFIRSLTS